jgi:dephospho-CoA kinase
MKQIKAAITGGISSGKSTFSSYLKSKGLPVILADDISNELLESDESIKNKVIKVFGKNSYSDGKPKRKFIAEQVFSYPEKLHKLNSILHPAVIQKIDSIIKKSYGNEKIVFIESALVYEAGIEKSFDYVILITADYKVREERSKKSGEFSKSDFERRNENQIPDEEKMKRADFIFVNNGYKKDLFKKADLLLLSLNSLKN